MKEGIGCCEIDCALLDSYLAIIDRICHDMTSYDVMSYDMIRYNVM